MSSSSISANLDVKYVLERFVIVSPERFNEMWEIYEQAFPKEERRSYEQQWKLFKKGHYKVLPCYIRKNDEMAGFITLWNLPAFTFVEHLAIKSDYRNQGLGAKLVKTVQDSSAKPIILEVEPPKTKIAQRRISFYERAGFYLNDYSYEQPPYEQGGNPVSLKLMSYPAPLDSKQFKGVQKSLYTIVYAVDL